MITGASTADLAIVLIDARKGVLTQTRRHTYLVSLVGIKQIVLAVNKMDLVGYDEQVYQQIVDEYLTFAKDLGITQITPISMSAFKGDNITSPSAAMSWYHGSTLMGFLETVAIEQDAALRKPFRMPVQWVNRPDQYFRGFAGTIVSGSIAEGDGIRIQPSGREAVVKSIVTRDGNLTKAIAGQAITLTLTEEVDISRGDVLCEKTNPATTADQFEAHIVWMHNEPLFPGRSYLLKLGTKTVNTTISRIKHQVNVNTLEKIAANQLKLNEVGVCNISTDQPLVFDTYLENKATGGFIMIDRLTNNTVAAGMIDFALRRAKNVVTQFFTVDKEKRAIQKGQKPAVLWFTGLSGSGKSTIANLVEQKLIAEGKHTYILDGDNVRHGLNKDLGFTEADRIENIRRVAEVAKLMVDAGLIVLVTFISPFRADREQARNIFAKDVFYEIFIDTPLGEAEKRDPKGLYKKARAGEIKNFTGIDSPYERPEKPELHIKTEAISAEDAVSLIMKLNT
jgi:bifunctional enzyme CysN/CysC